MNKLEAKFTTKFLKKWKDKWNWGFKIPDIWKTIKPFDWFWICEKWIFICEAKVIKKEIFNFSDIRDNQWTALERINELKKKYKFNNIFCCLLIFKEDWESKFIDFQLILDLDSYWEKKINFKEIKSFY
jgi:hypothetical protein